VGMTSSTAKVGTDGYSSLLSEIGFYPTPILDRYVGELAEWSRYNLSLGATAYLLTFKFEPLVGSRKALMRKMPTEIQRVYFTFLTRVIRKPQSQQSSRPILLGVPDLPVARRKKKARKDGLINDGLHYHGLLLMPPQSRLKQSVVDHFASNRKLYQRNFLLELHITPIRSNVAGVVDYIFKSFKRRRFAWDDWSIFG
jgi:hypothetical protein